MTIELAFDMKATSKDDGSIDYSVFQDKNRLPKHGVVHIYDTVTGDGPFRFYIAGITQPTPTSSAFTHKLVPLPTK